MNDVSFYVTWDSAKKSQTIESIAFFFWQTLFRQNVTDVVSSFSLYGMMFALIVYIV